MVYRFNNPLKKGPFNNSKVQPSDHTKAELYQSNLQVHHDTSTTTSIHEDSSAKEYDLVSMHMLQFIKELSLSKSKELHVCVLVIIIIVVVVVDR